MGAPDLQVAGLPSYLHQERRPARVKDFDISLKHIHNSKFLGQKIKTYIMTKMDR